MAQPKQTLMNTSLRTTRREFLQRASGGFGALALAGLWNELQGAPADPLAARPGHFPAKADRVIFLYSTGGVYTSIRLIINRSYAPTTANRSRPRAG